MSEKKENEDHPSCRLVWEGGKPIVECDTKEDVVKATAIITKEGVLIREVVVKNE